MEVQVPHHLLPKPGIPPVRGAWGLGSPFEFTRTPTREMRTCLGPNYVTLARFRTLVWSSRCDTLRAEALIARSMSGFVAYM